MLGAEHLLADRQRALEERPRLRIGGAAMEIAAGPVQKVGAFRVRSGVSHFRLAARERCGVSGAQRGHDAGLS